MMNRRHRDQGQVGATARDKSRAQERVVLTHAMAIAIDLAFEMTKEFGGILHLIDDEWRGMLLQKKLWLLVCEFCCTWKIKRDIVEIGKGGAQ